MPSLKWANAKSRFVVASGAAKVAGIVGMLLLVGLGGCVASTDESGVRDIEDVFFQEHWTPGEVQVRGTVANVNVTDTRGGVKTLVDFEVRKSHTLTIGEHEGEIHPDAAKVVLAGAHDLRVGETFEFTLHFDSYLLNNQTMVDARECSCSIATMGASLGEIVQGVSISSMALLRPTSWNNDGTVDFVVDFMGADPPPLHDATARVMLMPESEGTTLDGIGPQLDRMMGLFSNVTRLTQTGDHDTWPVAAELPNLGQSKETSGLSFEDVNHDGLLDEGDTFHAFVDSFAEDYRTAALVVRDLGSMRGMYSLLDAGYYRGASGVMAPGPLALFDASSETNGTAWDIVLTATRFLHTDSIPISGLNVSGSIRKSGGFEVRDVDRDGLFEVGDALVFPAQTWHSMHQYNVVFDPVGGAAVVAGKGSVLVGYDIDLRTAGHWTYNTTDQPAGVAAVASTRAWREYHFGRSLVASVSMGGVPLIENATVVAGEVASWPGGKLHYDDADQSGGLSQGDRVMLVDALPGTYRVELSAIFGHKSESVVLTV